MPAPDFNSDGVVDVYDLSFLLSRWGNTDTAADLNSDGTVDTFDLSLLLSDWGMLDPAIQLVVPDVTSPTIGQAIVKSHLESTGYTVSLQGAQDAIDVSGVDAVILCEESVIQYPGTGSNYRDASIGVLALGGNAIFEELHLSASWSYTSGLASMDVLDETHPVTSGHSLGNLTIYDTTVSMIWTASFNATTVVNLGSMPADTTKSTLFAYESGSVMSGGVSATARRVGFGVADTHIGSLNAQGLSILTQSIEWLVASTPTAQPVPLAPNNLSVTALDEGASLSWETSSNADTYTLKRSTVSGGPYSDVATDLTDASYTDINLTNDTTYYYVVTATNEAGTSPLSAEISVAPSAATPAGGLFDPLVYQARIANGGPWVSRADVETNSPGDWAWQTSQKDLFMTGWSAYDDTHPSPLPVEGGYTANGTEEDWGKSWQDHMEPLVGAAFYALVQGDSTVRSAAKSGLLAQVRATNTNADPAAGIFTTGTLHDLSPAFESAGVVGRMLYVYEFIWRSQFSASELAEVDLWFYWWSRLLGVDGDANLQKLYTDRYASADPSGLALTSTATAATSTTTSATYRWKLYDGGPDGRVISLYYNNRRMANIGNSSFVAAWLKQAGFGAPSGYPSLDTIIDWGLRTVKEWCAFGQYADGSFAGDHNRNDARYSDARSLSLSYASSGAGALVRFAELRARYGDRTAIEYETTHGGGLPGMDGAPAGFSGKSLRSGFTRLYDYLDGTVTRYVNGYSGQADYQIDGVHGSWIMVHDLSAAVGNTYWGDTDLATKINRTDTAMPPWPSGDTPSGLSLYYWAGGDWGALPGALFCYDGISFTYPA